MSVDRMGWAKAATLALGCAISAAGCGRAPSMGPDEEAFVTVDALYTAISMQDPGQLGRNAETLDRLHEAGRLPDSAHSALGAVIGEARGGDWESSRIRLRDFMLGQRGRSGG